MMTLRASTIFWLFCAALALTRAVLDYMDPLERRMVPPALVIATVCWLMAWYQQKRRRAPAKWNYKPGQLRHGSWFFFTRW